MANNARLLHALSLLLALKLTLACGGESTDTTGFTGNTSTTALTTDTGTSTSAPTSSTTLEASTGAATTTASSTGTVVTTDEASSTGAPDSTGTGTSTGTSTSDTTAGTGTGTSSGTTSDTSTGELPGDTIYAVQDGTIPAAIPVTLAGVIVTGIIPGKTGLFVQDPAGGEYSGIWVAVGDGPDIAALALGDEVDVTGITGEQNDRTEIDASAGSVIATGVKNLVVTPEPLPLALLVMPAGAELWESVLIRIDGKPLTVNGVDGGELKVSGNGSSILVDDYLYNVPADKVAFPALNVGSSFTQISGVLNGEFSVYKIAPRRAADLLGYLPK